MKTFVLDTNVLLHNAGALESFGDNLVILPMDVIEELDHFKSRNDEVGRNARSVIRRIDALRTRGALGQGVPMDNGGKLQILPSVSASGIKMDDRPDNKIIAMAYSLLKDGNHNIIFVSKDINARLKADALGLPAMDFEENKVRFDELYTGYREIEVAAEIVNEFYESEVLKLPGHQFNPNEFVMLKDITDAKHSALCKASGTSSVAHLSSRFELAYSIKPRNKEQRMALELLLDPSVQLVTLVGAAGTGKTLLALSAGLQAITYNHQYDRLLVSRPIIPFGKDLGYLPGDKDEKLSHWMQPIRDNLAYIIQCKNGKKKESERVIQKEMERFRQEHLIEMEALTYIRGRSIPYQYVIIDEAQNLTPHEIKTIISRAGEGTKVVLTGDPHQIDNPYLDASSNGLVYAACRMRGEGLHGHITLRKSERSELAGIAAKLL